MISMALKGFAEHNLKYNDSYKWYLHFTFTATISIWNVFLDYIRGQRLNYKSSRSGQIVEITLYRKSKICVTIIFH